MAALECPFCNQANPGAATFCMACGSRLSLKVCDRCQAINDRDVQHCYQCGTGFAAGIASREDEARAACARLQDMLRIQSALIPPAGVVNEPAAPIKVHAPSAPGLAAVPVFETRAQWQRRTARRKLLNTVLSTGALLSVVGIAGYLVYDHSYQMQAASSFAPARPAPVLQAPAQVPLERESQDSVAAGTQGASALAIVEAPTVQPALLAGTESRPDPSSTAPPAPSSSPGAAPAGACADALAAAGLCSPEIGQPDVQGAGEKQEPRIAPPAAPPQPALASVQPTLALEKTARTRAPSAEPTPAPARAGEPSPPVRPSACTAALIAAGLCSAEPTPRSP